MRKRKGMGHLLRTLTALLMVTLLVSVELAPVTALVTQADIDALKDDSAALDSKRKDLEQKLDELAGDKAQVLTQRKLLDEQIQNTSDQIKNVEAQIANYEDMIAQEEQALADAENREEAQYALFCERVRVMEEQGNVSYWSVLFGATSFSDMLTRLNDANEVMEADQRLMDGLRTLQEEIRVAKEELEGQKTECESAKADLVTKKSELDNQRNQAIALINRIHSNEVEYEGTLKELDEEEERIQAKIVQLSRQLAAQNKSSKSNPGGYIWPVDSRYITSTVGGRNSPGGVGSTNHKGTDIGRVGYTSSIYAAKAGTVIVSQYSSSYGNYVVIAHGSGNTTLYGHMSSRKVEVGAEVDQGDVIGITGSTGNSTGPHLHFEITENGQRINPLSHGAEPQLGYLSGYTLSGSAVGS